MSRRHIRTRIVMTDSTKSHEIGLGMVPTVLGTAETRFKVQHIPFVVLLILSSPRNVDISLVTTLKNEATDLIQEGY